MRETTNNQNGGGNIDPLQRLKAKAILTPLKLSITIR